MRKALILMALLLILVGCDDDNSNGQKSIKGSGTVITRTESITNFSKISASHTFVVEVRQGTSFSVEITLDDNLEEYLVAERRGQTLVLGLESGNSYNNTHLQATITMPSLHGMALSGASDGSISGFDSNDRFEVDLSGASHLRGSITAGDVDIALSGASEVNLWGGGRHGELNVSGASRVALDEFPLTDVDVKASGASQVRVYATGQLDIEASGASNLTYLGEPTLGRMETSGASTITRG